MLLTSVKENEGRAEIDGVGRAVRLDLVPGVREGEYVIVHAGYAIQVLDETSAKETLALISEALGAGS
jgi:hydrogenase expression/formation protein HypC